MHCECVWRNENRTVDILVFLHGENMVLLFHRFFFLIETTETSKFCD